MQSTLKHQSFTKSCVYTALQVLQVQLPVQFTGIRLPSRRCYWNGARSSVPDMRYRHINSMHNCFVLLTYSDNHSVNMIIRILTLGGRAITFGRLGNGLNGMLPLQCTKRNTCSQCPNRHTRWPLAVVIFLLIKEIDCSRMGQCGCAMFL